MKNFRIEFINGLTFYVSTFSAFTALLVAHYQYKQLQGDHCPKLKTINQL